MSNYQDNERFSRRMDIFLMVLGFIIPVVGIVLIIVEAIRVNREWGRWKKAEREKERAYERNFYR